MVVVDRRKETTLPIERLLLLFTASAGSYGYDNGELVDGG